MTANQGSPGVWVDRSSRLDAYGGQPQWDASLPIPPLPPTPARLDRGLPLAGKLTLVGLALLVQSALMLAGDWDFIVATEQTIGEIVDFRSGPRGDHAIAAYLVDGRTYRAIGNATSHRPMYDIGDEVTVSYLAAHPERATIDAFGDVYLFPALLVTISCLLILIAAGSLVWTQRRATTLGSSTAYRSETGFARRGR